MNVVRALVAAYSLVLVALGWRHYRTGLNPISALCGPLAATLIIEQFALSDSSLGGRAAVILVAMEAAFTVGALAGPVGRPISGARILLKRGSPKTFAAFLLVAIAVFAVGAQYTLHVYNSVPSAHSQSGLFDRSVVEANIAGSSQELLIRVVTVLQFPLAVALAFYWLIRGRGRRWLTAAYFASVAMFAFATRARLAAVLATVLLLIVIFLAQRGRLQRRAIPAIAVATIVIVGIFSHVADQRYGPHAHFAGHTPTRDFLYSTVGGPAAFSQVIGGYQDVQLVSYPDLHSRGQSVAGILSVVSSRARALGSFTPVYAGKDESSRINIYTGAWLLIWDLGTRLSIAMMLVLGVVARVTYRRFLTVGSPGSMIATMNILFLLVCFPVTLLSTYNLWWVLFLLVPVANRLFTVELTRSGNDSGAYSQVASRQLHVL